MYQGYATCQNLQLSLHRTIMIKLVCGFNINTFLVHNIHFHFLGKVHCTVEGTVGPQAWPLPPMDMPYPDGVDNVKWFARFLLEGKPFKKLQKYVKSLLSQPSVMVKSWAR